MAGSSSVRMAGARQVIGAQLVAHDEQDILDRAHTFPPSTDFAPLAYLSRMTRARPSAMFSISGSCRLPIPATASRATCGGLGAGRVRRRDPHPLRRGLRRRRSPAPSTPGGSRPTARWPTSFCATSSRATCTARRRGAFAGDGKALETARLALARAYPAAFNPTMRLFFYMPFQHSEALADQELGCSLFAAFEDEEPMKHALEHREVIARFGRFPASQRRAGPRLHAGGAGLPQGRRSASGSDRAIEMRPCRRRSSRRGCARGCRHAPRPRARRSRSPGPLG